MNCLIFKNILNKRSIYHIAHLRNISSKIIPEYWLKERGQKLISPFREKNGPSFVKQIESPL